MAVMKVLLSTNKTMYIHKPHDISYIEDIESGGLKLGFPDYQYEAAKIQTTLTARAFKREIQENSREETAWLKISLDYISKTARMYVNAKEIVAIEGFVIKEDVGHLSAGLYTQFIMTHAGHVPTLKIDPTELNRQLYRIQNRLEQDEDICCTEKVTVEPPSE